ncbi:MAG: hypothetical protein WDZ75_01725 [Candidatus Paceibacterota bacterium]
MIIGHGTIASVLPESSFLFFASGVSNSSETRESEYQREIDLLLDQDRRKHIVYFSTLSMFYNSTRYVQHKIFMEGLIKKTFKRWTIMRLGSPAWGSNPNHLVNYFRLKIKNNEPFQVWDTERYVLEKEEFLHWVSRIPSFNCEMNVPGIRMKVKDIVKKYGKDNS